MSNTEFKHASYGAKINVSNSMIESIELGELQFENLITRHKERLLSDRYKGYDKTEMQKPITASN